MEYSIGFVCFLMLVSLATACGPNNYCDAVLMPLKTTIKNREVRCTALATEDIKDNCCLTGPHLVCYNIRVDGNELNIDLDRPSKSTDIDALCEELASSQGFTAGRYTGMTTDAGGGHLAFKNKKFKRIVVPSDSHVENIACEIITSN